MHPFTALWAILEAVVLFSITARAANWNTDVGILVTERLDPIISPNGVASHMHSIIGGSAFGAAYNQPDLMKSACSTFPISIDKSNYWHPTPYWINNNGSSFTPLPIHDRVYYIREQNSPNEPIQPFPEGLRMIVGNPMSKSADRRSFEFLCRVAEEFDGPGDIWSDNWQFERDCPRGILVSRNLLASSVSLMITLTLRLNTSSRHAGTARTSTSLTSRTWHTLNTMLSTGLAQPPIRSGCRASCSRS